MSAPEDRIEKALQVAEELLQSDNETVRAKAAQLILSRDGRASANVKEPADNGGVRVVEIHGSLPASALALQADELEDTQRMIDGKPPRKRRRRKIDPASITLRDDTVIPAAQLREQEAQAADIRQARADAYADARAEAQDSATRGPEESATLTAAEIVAGLGALEAASD